MKYVKGKPVKRHKPWYRLLVIGAVVMIVVAGYFLYLAYVPRLVVSPLAGHVPGLANQAPATKATSDQDAIIIPKINLNVAISNGTNEAALLKGAWHRYPERGDPVKGGNFILAAHRFLLGWTPQQTRAKSPFYNIDKLAVNDPIDVQFGGKLYHYRVSKSYSVKPDAVYIEASSQTAKLTLYSCTLKGSADGRLVIEALPLE